MLQKVSKFIVIIILMLWCHQIFGQSVRIKDLVNIRGVRSNQLVGFGLVIGLSGSGDTAKSLATTKAMSSMVTKLGMKLDPKDVTSGSVAGVIVTVDLPAFARNGDRLDVKVSTIGDAKSLAGGTLLMTPLKAGDGNVYVIAQGAVVVGQASGTGPQVLTVARIPEGGVVEKEFRPKLAPDGLLILSLRNPDFTTNSRIADVVNSHFKGFFAKAIDPVSTEVKVPPLHQDNIIEFISELELLKVDVDHKAVVVLNERTGTVVVGGDVTIGPVAIAHGDLMIQVGQGQKTTKEPMVEVKGPTVSKLVETLNALGIKPGDLVGIFQAIHAAGALQADLLFR